MLSLNLQQLLLLLECQGCGSHCVIAHHPNTNRPQALLKQCIVGSTTAWMTEDDVVVSVLTKSTKSVSLRDMDTLFNIALFMVTKIGNQPKIPPMGCMHKEIVTCRHSRMLSNLKNMHEPGALHVK